MVIASVACVDHQVPTVEAARDRKRARGVGHPRRPSIIDVSPQARLVFVAFAQHIGDKVFNAPPVARENAQLIGVERLRQTPAEVLIDSSHRFRCERLRTKRLVDVDRDASFLLVDRATVAAHGFARHVAWQTVGKKILTDNLFCGAIASMFLGNDGGE